MSAGLVPASGARRGACLAVDVGGTKLAAGVVEPSGWVRIVRQVPTPATTDADALFAALCDLVDSVLLAASAAAPSAGPTCCGIGCGGPIDAAGRVSPLNIPAWRGFPLAERLAEHTGLRTAVDNDAKAMALAEGWCGAAAGATDFIAMVVSTGVGGGIVLDGRLLDGAAGNAGHIGHVVVEPDGRRCACGGRGCLEAEASGTAIRAATGRPADEAPLGVRERTGRLVGRAVASVVNLLDLRLAVVGGSVALGFGPEFFAAAEAELAERSRIEFAKGATIVPAGLGADAPIVGAAAVGWRAAATGAQTGIGCSPSPAPARR